ncbi:UDP-N-acetylmuramoyl-L-alanyl-D-glutamate--2,6-diaminopimelate ligase [Enemella evansiae]|uniref:UDP-N-acetylmuramoyl-L-alanyl-D-glutamate--2,6-diaminopimelate ligase n=1 Tax=Enemella evansiae TaxID=2016499 RepID=A0A255GH00_9ACTN|nr:UDP-N-acetylmuramoyl-L-alanyl-D-glutamate--2,6-diaminopimelate ligase [Enemella evansiae]OYO14702.1 UDP-N-acetylmuramoyl-L-alanyl-D-glutamate--2,6-diaminopimelate ligase [Enemella evansiae]
MSDQSRGARGLLRPAPHPVPLARLLPGQSGVPADAGAPDLDQVQVSGVTLDSRIVAPGDLYVALPGARVHGADFAAGAVAAGAVAVLTDPTGAERATVPPGVPVLVVDDPRQAMAALAAEVYGRPAEALRGFAVTGTNGKTTTTHFLAAALHRLGLSVGTIGTIGFRLDDQPLVGPRTTVTTPESVDLQGLLGLMVERGADAVAMEVSSHALALHRADGVRFDVAGFTNLGRDHLEFHHTMANYFEAKAQLFTPEHCARAAIVVDDEWGVRLARRLAERGDVPFRTVSWDNHPVPGGRPPVDYRVTNVDGSWIEVRTPTAEWRFECALPGDFNVRNAVLALAMIDLANLDSSDARLDAATAAEAFAELAVPGRMQPVRLGAGAPRAFVDFAHTPQAVDAVLSAFATERRAGARVIAVLGAGGDRDPSKRRPMGAIAAATADVLVVTDDNPRTEDPAAIRAEVIAGAGETAVEPGTTGERAEVVDGGDRRQAITAALRLAGPDDIVAVLGKGHEQGQESNGTTVPFDDATVLAEAWAGLAAGATGQQEQMTSGEERR